MKFSDSIMEEDVTKKVVISGYYGFNNFGDEEILSVLLSKLKQWNTDITVFSSNPDWSSSVHDVKAVCSFNLQQVIKTIIKSDIIISGGGSLLQDVTSLKSLIYYSLIIFIALFFRKKVIIFAQGIGPINNSFARFIVMNIIRFCSFITVRDENSYNLLKKYKIKAKLVSDPVYSIDVNHVNHACEVGVQLREFKTVSDEFLNILAHQVVKNFSDKKIKIFSLQDALDLDICNSFRIKLNNISKDIKTEVVTNNSLLSIAEQLSSLEYLIAMRFHALIIGIKAGVKSLGINYDIKVEQLANDASIPLLSLEDFSDFDEKFQSLKEESSAALSDFARSKQFCWDEIKQFFD